MKLFVFTPRGSTPAWLSRRWCCCRCCCCLHCCTGVGFIQSVAIFSLGLPDRISRLKRDPSSAGRLLLLLPVLPILIWRKFRLRRLNKIFRFRTNFFIHFSEFKIRQQADNHNFAVFTEMRHNTICYETSSSTH